MSKIRLTTLSLFVLIVYFLAALSPSILASHPINLNPVNNFTTLSPSVTLLSPNIDSLSAHQTKKIITVLAIDGGGMYGILPARLLRELETRSGKPASELFDVMVGTSTAALLVTALSIPGIHHHPKYSANHIINVYSTYGREIFKKTIWHSILTMGGLIGPKYSADNLNQVINKLIGSKLKLSQLRGHVIVPCGTLLDNYPFWFSNDQAEIFPKKDFYLHDVIAAALSAPSIFPPHKFSNISNTWTDFGFDAAIYINNPTLQAYLDAKSLYPHHKYLIVSLGTGISQPLQRTKNPTDFEHWGKIQEIIPVLLKTMGYHADQTEYQMRMLFKQKSSSIIGYYRFNIRDNTLENSSRSIFSGSQNNINHINKLASLMVANNSQRIETLLQILNKIKS